MEREKTSAQEPETAKRKSIKTLLVGLGGTGCEIATRVKNLIHGADENVQFVGFDTDGNWGGVDGLPMVYTSREMTVKQYLRDIDNWEEWFPDNASLKQRNMIKGAGQVRFLSRLAFAETISSNRIGNLRDAIRALKISRGNVAPNNFRIMIISSFAGGTGSGMFLQTALFLRDFIRREYGGEVIIRGLFALPDIFMSRSFNSIQKESMYANAYAALKELNAMNQVTLSQNAGADEINMRIDDLFDSKRDRCNAGKKPFDFIFFVDNINSRGMVMASLEEYKRLMTTAAYMQVYSPITDAGDSREDNAILTIIGTDGNVLYGSVGASQIIYPYEDLLDYCSKRATLESVSEVWTLIDEEYKQAKAENERMIELDPTVKPLDRGAHFQAALQTYLEAGNSRLNFIKRAAEQIDDDGKRLDRAEMFFDTVRNYILDKIRNDAGVKTRGDEAYITEKHLKSKDIVANVSANETKLKLYLDEVNDRIMLLRSSMAMSIMPDDLSKPLNTDADWNILQLMKNQGSLIHPLAARQLLYHLRDLVAEEYNAATTKWTSSKKHINQYFTNAYDLESTEDVVETAVLRAGKKGAARRQFRADYLQKSAEQKARIDQYRDSKALSVVLGDVLTRLNALIWQYERLFDSLGDICSQLRHEVEVLETSMHANTAEPAIYLCADAEEKRALYDSLDFQCSDSAENEVYDAIFYSLYELAMEVVQQERGKTAANRKKHGTRAEREGRVTAMSKVFRENILRRNREDIAEKCADKLDIDVFQALRKETEDDSARMSAILDTAYEKARPYLLTSLTHKIVSLSEAGSGNGDCAYTLTFWGIHPDVQSEILSDRALTDMTGFFKAGDMGFEPEVVADKEYSRYMISCYQALYCVSLTEIPKFADTGNSDTFGVYYKNYAQRIRKLGQNDRTAISPHLDIHWHQRKYLPMISDRKNREDDENTARAIWLALIYGGLPEEEQDGQMVLFASFARIVGARSAIEERYPKCDILYEGRPVSIQCPYELFKALQMDEITVSRFLEVFTKSKETDCEQGTRRLEISGPRARTFARKLISEGVGERNALNIISNFVTDTRASESEKQLFTDALLKLLEELCSGMTTERKEDLRRAILTASRFAKNKKARTKVNRYISFDYWDIQS